ncbi:MAG: GAF domain-containing protein, partial [bacterium]
MVPAVLLLLAAEGMRLISPEKHFDTTTDYLLSLWPNGTLALVGLAINTAYRVLIRKGGTLRPVALAQVWLDIVLFALMIFTTGGVSSPFAFLFTVPVLAASLLLSFRTSLAAAFTSTALMGLLAFLQYRHIIPSERYFEPLLPLTQKGAFVIAMVTLNGVLYFLIAVASGALSSTVHKYEQDLARRANESTMLYEVSSSLQSTTHLDEVLIQIMDILVKRLDIDHALMYLTNDAGDGLDLKLERFHPRLRNPPYGQMKVHMDLKREAGLTAICALEKRAFNVMDPLNHPLINKELAQRLGINPFAVAPMLARGRVVGVVGIDRRCQKAIITQEEAQIMGVAGNQAG